MDDYKCRLTIVYNNTRNPERLFHSIEGFDNIFRLGEIARDVKLTVCAVCFFDGASGETNSVAFRGELASDRLADVGTCTDDEGDWRFGGHCG